VRPVLDGLIENVDAVTVNRQSEVAVLAFLGGVAARRKGSSAGNRVAPQAGDGVLIVPTLMVSRIAADLQRISRVALHGSTSWITSMCDQS
jgi:hypothetical protein